MNKTSKLEMKIFAFYAVTFLIRIAFASFVPLIDDEAYHWSWTQDLSLSYFDHPAMIAWLEYISTHLFGNSYFAVRLPSFLCFTGVVLVAFNLTKSIFNSSWAGHFVAFMLLWTPFWGFGGYVASPEPPYMFCWISAVYIFWQSIREDVARWPSHKAWIILGLVMGAGLNSKFIIALLAPGFALYMLTDSKQRKVLLTPWPWLGFLIATLMVYPIFKWNMQFDWPSFKYQFHDRHGDGEFSLSKYMGFLSAQIFFLTPIGYFLMIFSFSRGARNFLTSLNLSRLEKIDYRWKMLFCLAAPAIFIFYSQALFSDFKPHWSGAAYLILTIGSGEIWARGFKTQTRVWIQPLSSKIVKGLMLFLVPINLLIYSPFLGPWLPKVYRSFSPDKPWNPQWDLSNEFHGWEDFGDHLNSRQREIEKTTGQRPFLAAHRYETTAQTYWGTKQRVITLNRTRSHYTVTTSEEYLNSLRGKSALVVHSDKYSFDPNKWIRWDSCEKELYTTYRGKEPSHIFTIYYCKNFQGLTEPVP